DDATPAAVEAGMQNSRLFDAIACGATVVTNNALGLDDLGLEEVLTYGRPDELASVVRNEAANEAKRLERTERLRKVVSARHTYERRAETVTELLERPRRVTATRDGLLAWATHLREDLRSAD